MRTIIITLCILFTPALAGAHAVPLQSAPSSSGSVSSAPDTVEIRFSERIDVAASRVSVVGPSGQVVSEGTAQSGREDPYTIAMSIKDDGSGAYVVSWSVVSSDDGHFTKGAFPFAVGEGVVVDPSLVRDTEIVQIATLPEVLGMTVELFGHGLLWALLVLFALAVRPLMRAGRFPERHEFFVTAYGLIAAVGAGLALLGALFQLFYKTKDLALLHASGIVDALPQYLSTVAGEATLWRMGAALCFAVLAVVFRRAIIASVRFTWREALLLAVLCSFAFFRAKVSHATANHFFPDFSIGINFIHLIEKDIWAGILAVLCVGLLMVRTRDIVAALVPRASAMLTLNLAVVSVTASYIVWLHLKDLEKLFTTQWGAALMELVLAAAFLAALRAYHVLAGVLRPALYEKLLPATLGAEFALALAMLFSSSAIIITSPPAQTLPMPAYAQRSEGTLISFEKNPYKDDSMRIIIIGEGGPEAPAATLAADDETALELALVEVFPGAYEFPASLLRPQQSYTLDIRVPQTAAYDAHVVFDIPAGAYEASSYKDSVRIFDSFTLLMISVAFLGLLGGAYLLHLNARAGSVRFAQRYADFAVIAGFTAAALIVASLIGLLRASPLPNPYRALCEADGNMWHLMLPSRAGVPLSLTPQEGCMWGMGSFQYMFPERAEYEHYRAMPPAHVSVDFDDGTIAGQTAHFSVSVRNEDGTPAELFVDMEKLVHVVIVSKDQTVFAHIHPDDDRVLTEEEKRTSTFHLTYTFPKAGEYLVSVDYANGLTLESSQHEVRVSGTPVQSAIAATYSSPASVGGFEVSVDYSQPFVGKVATLIYDIRREGQAAELEPYLSAAMHIAVVKNDFGAFAHTHGEVHPPGAAMPPVSVRDGKIVHSMAAMRAPAQFSYPIDAHVIFPEAGLYTVWAQFQSGGFVHVIPLTVRVEQ